MHVADSRLLILRIAAAIKLRSLVKALEMMDVQLERSESPAQLFTDGRECPNGIIWEGHPRPP